MNGGLSLYQINERYQQALRALVVDEETGEVLNYQLLDEMEDVLEDKLESLALLSKAVAAEAAAIKAEEDALAKRRKSKERLIARLRGSIGTAMTAAGMDRLERARCKVSFTPSVTVEIDALDTVPKQYIRIKEEPDKTAIKRAIQGGEEVTGARLAEHRNLQIK